MRYWGHQVTECMLGLQALFESKGMSPLPLKEDQHAVQGALPNWLKNHQAVDAPLRLIISGNEQPKLMSSRFSNRGG